MVEKKEMQAREGTNDGFMIRHVAGSTLRSKGEAVTVVAAVLLVVTVAALKAMPAAFVAAVTTVAPDVEPREPITPTRRPNMSVLFGQFFSDMFGSGCYIIFSQKFPDKMREKMCAYMCMCVRTLEFMILAKRLSAM